MNDDFDNSKDDKEALRVWFLTDAHLGLPDPDSSPQTLAGAPTAIPESITGTHCKCGCGVRLTGRQKHFASRLCSSRWWDAQHPRINRGPAGPREATIKSLILGLLQDGQWRTEQEIADAIRAFPHSVGARLSELRRAGHRIETDAKNGNSRRAHRVRLIGGER